MNAYTFISLIVLIITIIKGLQAIREQEALSIAGEQGRKKRTEYSNIMSRQNKTGDYGIIGDWK
jgi:hypothetical protein